MRTPRLARRSRASGTWARDAGQADQADRLQLDLVEGGGEIVALVARARARRRCRHRRSANLPPARNRRTASRSSWVTARPCSVSASRTSRPATRGSRGRRVERQHDVGDGRRRPQLEVEQVGRARGLARGSRASRRSAGSGPAGSCALRHEPPDDDRRPPAITSRARPPMVASRPTRKRRMRRPRAQAALGRRVALALALGPQLAAGGQDVAAARRAHRRGVAGRLDDRARRRGCGCSTSRCRASRARG